MAKTESDWLKKVGVSFLRKHDYFCGWKSGVISWGENGDGGSIGVGVSVMDDKYIQFPNSQTGFNDNKKEFDYKVRLATTPCRYGGVRYWFICPLSKNGVYCGKRVGVLYKGNEYFGCRNCYNLTYSSRNESRGFKHRPLFQAIHLMDKANKMEAKMRRWQYAGKPTKKYQKLERIYKKISATNSLLRY